MKKWLGLIGFLGGLRLIDFRHLNTSEPETVFEMSTYP